MKGEDRLGPADLLAEEGQTDGIVEGRQFDRLAVNAAVDLTMTLKGVGLGTLGFRTRRRLFLPLARYHVPAATNRCLPQRGQVSRSEPPPVL